MFHIRHTGPTPDFKFDFRSGVLFAVKLKPRIGPSKRTTNFALTYSALSLNEMGARPGGTPNTFCDPVYITSIPKSSMAMGTPPSEATVSTANRQLYLETRKDRVKSKQKRY